MSPFPSVEHLSRLELTVIILLCIWSWLLINGPFHCCCRFMTDAARREQESLKKKIQPKLSLTLSSSVSRGNVSTPPRHSSGSLTPPVTPPITPSSSFRSSTPTGEWLGPWWVCVCVWCAGGRGQIMIQTHLFFDPLLVPIAFADSFIYLLWKKYL